MPKARPVEERIADLTELIPFHTCHEWLGAKISGYGRISKQPRGTHMSVTRFLLGKKIGRELLSHERACHTCDNPGCVNPKHLFLGTDLDNHRDMVKKGRWKGRVYELKIRTHCMKGHPFEPDNVYYRLKGGGRLCRTCHRITAQRNRDKRKAINDAR